MADKVTKKAKKGTRKSTGNKGEDSDNKRGSKTRTTKAQRSKAQRSAAGKLSSADVARYPKRGELLVVQQPPRKPVPPSKMEAGFKKALTEVNNLLETIPATQQSGWCISEVELALTINAKGEFLGFGVSGGTTLKVKITRER